MPMPSVESVETIDTTGAVEPVDTAKSTGLNQTAGDLGYEMIAGSLPLSQAALEHLRNASAEMAKAGPGFAEKINASNPRVFVELIEDNDDDLLDLDDTTEESGIAGEISNAIREKISSVDFVSPYGTPILDTIKQDLIIRSLDGETGLPHFCSFRFTGQSDVQMTTRKRNARTKTDEIVEANWNGELSITLPPGSYQVQQIDAQPGCLLNGITHDLQVGTSGFVLDGVYSDEMKGLIIPRLAQAYRVRIVGSSGDPVILPYRLVGYATTKLGEIDAELPITPDDDGYMCFSLPAGRFTLFNLIQPDRKILDIEVLPPLTDTPNVVEASIVYDPPQSTAPPANTAAPAEN